MNITSYFSKRMNLNEFSKSEKEKILYIIVRFLLGRISYSDSFSKLKEYGVSNDFSIALRELDSKRIHYVMSKFRYHAKGLGKDIIPSGLNGVGDSDYRILRVFISKIRYNKVKIIKNYPTEEDVLKSFNPKIVKLAKMIHQSFNSDRSLEIKDIISELSLKLIQAYRLYIFNIGVKNFNLKVFYSCLHRGLQTRKLDISSGMFKDKRTISMFTTSLNEDEMEGNMVYYGSPEDILIAKEEYIKLKQNEEKDADIPPLPVIH